MVPADDLYDDGDTEDDDAFYDEFYECDRDEADLTIVFPAPQGRPNAVMVHKSVLSAHSMFFSNLFLRNPTLDAFVVKQRVEEDDVRAILSWMYDASVVVDAWPSASLERCLVLARQLEMATLVNSIRDCMKKKE